MLKSKPTRPAIRSCVDINYLSWENRIPDRDELPNRFHVRAVNFVLLSPQSSSRADDIVTSSCLVRCHPDCPKSISTASVCISKGSSLCPTSARLQACVLIQYEFDARSVCSGASPVEHALPSEHSVHGLGRVDERNRPYDCHRCVLGSHEWCFEVIVSPSRID